MTGPHDTVGLISKYKVLKQAAGSSFGNVTWVEKTTPCFVLSPEKDDAYGVASCEALLAYAAAIRGVNRQLSDDLRAWVKRIEAKP